MFLTFHIKPSIILCCVVLCCFMVSYLVVNKISNVNSVNALNYTIVLDAGHGGMDGGTEGRKTKVKESELNLVIVKKLEKYLKSFGFKVVLTRNNDEGLYDKFNSTYKQQDMQKRKEIIQKNNANLVLSIHMNSFPSSALRGAQAFYDVSSPSSKLFADVVQEQLFSNIPHAKENSNFGDYYILKCTQNPSIMIECGFLTNQEEELLLKQDDYQEQMAYQIFCGIVKYFQHIN